MNRSPKSLRDLDTKFRNSILLDGIIPTVGESAWAVYCIIKLFADYTTGLSYPKQTTIMELTGLGRTAVRSARRKLQAEGCLTYEFRKAADLSGLEYGRRRYFYKLPQ